MQVPTEQTYSVVDRNVIISGYKAAADPKLIKRYNIKRVVSILRDRGGDLAKHPGVIHVNFPVDDSPRYNEGMKKAALGAIKIIQEGIRRGEVVLVHCHAGISRSATVVLLHLMINRQMTLKEAFKHLRSVRPQVDPKFTAMLRATDASLQRLRQKQREESAGRVPWWGGGEGAGERTEKVEPVSIPETSEWQFDG
ncbi:MAG: dual specificity protein phosphatase family protein [Patescibacteria group bacterium]|nr:dual specificity protein phosphatase family protein [Patescibacteria group bacterium]